MQLGKVGLLLLAARAAESAVIGIDFGSRFLKVGIIQPGTGIELVLNEATKRKSSSAVRTPPPAASHASTPRPHGPPPPPARRRASRRRRSASTATSRTT